jgi:hypothetical protein
MKQREFIGVTAAEALLELLKIIFAKHPSG